MGGDCGAGGRAAPWTRWFGWWALSGRAVPCGSAESWRGAQVPPSQGLSSGRIRPWPHSRRGTEAWRLCPGGTGRLVWTRVHLVGEGLAARRQTVQTAAPLLFMFTIRLWTLVGA
ncbi:hypothetical protein NDU88_007215 [Pleurodeles waltl]|uniref:Uncharacterized protein n=1 Tax=Pleurodeles waltl TaxID=8319 RepID=A0AAV7SRR9_PLEWA|nr:hypothetical protein NDU88_007215 [Pleurodeles waltl]